MFARKRRVAALNPAAIALCAGALAGLVASCGGQAVEQVFRSNDGAAAIGNQDSSAGAGGASTAGTSTVAGESSIGGAGQMSAGDAGAPSGGGTSGEAGHAESDGGAAAGGASAGAAAGGENVAGGAGGAGGSAGEPTEKPCASTTECPKPANGCLKALCDGGICVTENVPAGAVFVPDRPADCHATTACDGFGHATIELDQGNAPRPGNPCLVGTCNSSGVAGTEPAPQGLRCSWDFVVGKCDGSGSCVACLSNADCALGQTCSAFHDCVGEPCSASKCGGACPACEGVACLSDADCASSDCGDASSVCVLDPQCADQQQDGNETATDCGGGGCPECALGKACLTNTDCDSAVCDAVSHLCIADACSDHQTDSDESDLDCGGSEHPCARCDVGQKCHISPDCKPGHICIGKICQ